MIRAVFAIALGLLLPGCSEEPASDIGKPQSVVAQPIQHRPVAQAAEGDRLIADAWLRQHLPSQMLAYIRVPNPWALVGGGMAAENDPVAATAAYVKTVKSLRAGAARSVIPHLPAELRPALALLLQHSRSAVEALVLPDESSNVPLPRTLITLLSDYTSPAAVQALLQSLDSSDKSISLTKPMDDQGLAAMSVKGLPVQVFWRQDDQRIFFLSGTTEADLPVLVATLHRAAEHPMFGIEQQVDASGQGFFVWVDGKHAVRMLGAMQDASVQGVLNGSGAGKIESVSMGIGGAGGLGRIKLMLEMPRVSFRSFLPLVDKPITLTAAGEPSALVVLGMPDELDLERFEALFMLAQGREKAAEYRQRKQQFFDAFGFSINELFSVFNEELVLMSDEAGTTVSARIGQLETFHKIRDALIAKFKLVYRKRQVNGQTIHYLKLPDLAAIGEIFDDNNDLQSDELNLLVRRYFTQTGSVYWVEEGDYAMFASVPQVLIDRHYIQARTPVADWLQDQQRMDPSGALLMLSTRVPGVPKMMYYFDLGVLQWLGEYVGEPVDLFDFPTARELGLAADGAYSLKLTSSENVLAFELGYEYNPAEILLGGSNAMSGIAVVGILAAIAVPAYQQYVVKAKIAASLALVEPIKMQVLQVVMDKQRYPNTDEIAKFGLQDMATQEFGFLVQPDTGVIEVLYYLSALDGGSSVTFIPSFEDGRLVWRCDGDISTQYLPDECY